MREDLKRIVDRKIEKKFPFKEKERGSVEHFFRFHWSEDVLLAYFRAWKKAEEEDKAITLYNIEQRRKQNHELATVLVMTAKEVRAWLEENKTL